MSFLTSLLGSVAGKLLADEARDLILWLSPRLIRWSAKRFDGELAQRYEEEWLAHAQDIPGSLHKFWHSLGCTWTALNYDAGCARTLLRFVLRPVIEVVMPVAMVAVVVVVVFIGVILVLAGYSSHPESVRAARLRRHAGGLTVLGLCELELLPCDFEPSQFDSNFDRKFRRLMNTNIVLRVFDEEARVVFERYIPVFRPVLMRILF